VDQGRRLNAAAGLGILVIVQSINVATEVKLMTKKSNDSSGNSEEAV
jgi:hypothetical protein